MPSIALTPFQVRAEILISTILHDAGLSVTSRDISQFKPPSTIQAPHCRCYTSRAPLLNSGFTMMNLVSEFVRQTTSRRPKRTAMWMHNSIMRRKLCDEPSPGAQPNKRLKLPGGDRFKGSGVLCL